VSFDGVCNNDIKECHENEEFLLVDN